MRIVISSEPRLLHILRAVVKYHAQESGFSTEDAECLALAIDEAASNVIRHTYNNRPDAELALEIRIFPDRVEFTLEDAGPKVQPESIHHRCLDDLRPGGLGTYFINCFIDETSYDRDLPQGNRLRMVKYLSRKVRPGNANPG